MEPSLSHYGWEVELKKGWNSLFLQYSFRSMAWGSRKQPQGPAPEYPTTQGPAPEYPTTAQQAEDQVRHTDFGGPIRNKRGGTSTSALAAPTFNLIYIKNPLKLWGWFRFASETLPNHLKDELRPHAWVECVQWFCLSRSRPVFVFPWSDQVCVRVLHLWAFASLQEWISITEVLTACQAFAFKIMPICMFVCLMSIFHI